MKRSSASAAALRHKMDCGDVGACFRMLAKSLPQAVASEDDERKRNALEMVLEICSNFERKCQGKRCDGNEFTFDSFVQVL